MIIISLPTHGFDPTEAAIPWSVLSQHGIKIYFATPDKKKSRADSRMISQGLGLLSPFLMTPKLVLNIYQKMINTPEFKKPLAYDEIDIAMLQGIVIPGGHGEGMKSMLESTTLQQKIVQIFHSNKIIAAICTGVLTVARSMDPKTKKSILFDKKTTAVTRWMELAGWYLTRYFLDNYYRVYPITVQDEIEGLLNNKSQFFNGGLRIFPMIYTKHFFRYQFTIIDGNYLSGRWPGDSYRFADNLLTLIKKQFKEEII